MQIEFWKDKNKKQIDPELFSSKAESLAKMISQERSVRINNPTQIRKFYDEILRFNSIIKNNPSEFEQLLPYIKMLNAKATYAAGRNLVSTGFKNFITYSINQIENLDDFSVFASFFEAFMGFFKFYVEKGFPQEVQR